ncbi:MAG: hypothetical protein NVSMB7_15740 [Chitinophagaceae bacterium]
MEEEALIQIINSEMDLGWPPQMPLNDIRRRLQAAVNGLIENDFQKLVYVLYRIDVNERKLKYLLQENVGEEAAVIIADLIIARQIEKIASRRQFNRQNDAPGDEERW